jgi:hypothetical protein
VENPAGLRQPTMEKEIGEERGPTARVLCATPLPHPSLYKGQGVGKIGLLSKSRASGLP